jgi:predicted O-linked N-acetylglucosamine transferase (SPINDLY family)
LNLDRQQQLQRAIQNHQAGRLEEAEQLYTQILDGEPGNFLACQYLGVIRHQQGRSAEAVALIGAALKINPDSAGALSNYGLALNTDGRPAEALASFDKAIALNPGDPESQNNRGLALQAMERLPEALAGFERAIALRPGHADAWNNRGNVLSQMKRFEKAVACFDKAIAIQPKFAIALNNRGNALLALGRSDEALASYDQALATDPRFALAHYNRGQPLLDAMRLKEALESYDRAIALDPSLAKALNGRAIVLQRMGRDAEALASYEASLRIAPEQDTANNFAGLLMKSRRFTEAKAVFESVLHAMPQDDVAFGGLAAVALYLCDWPLVDELAPEIRRRIEAGRAAVDPLVVMGYFDDPALQSQASKNHQHERVPILPHALSRSRVPDDARIRIAYLSAEFHTHAVASLAAGLYEHHDRNRFEVSAIAIGPDDNSAMRARLQRAFEHFDDVRHLSDADVARLIANRGVDIAIDLTGHTQNARPGILAFRPAPVQVNYLGFPGTSGAAYIDYIIADRIVVPPEHQRFFTENIVYLPHAYQANDVARAIATTPTRREAGLPDEGFVFCCFNNSWKITLPVFHIWMRMLAAVPGSLLWLIADNEGANENLRRAAKIRGIAADRLVFAPKLPEPRHLARQRLAGLFLDTQPYNAHTTASDALWAGLPVVTCMGNAFPSRVATSLLHAVGLPELGTHSLADYEALALGLARDPPRLQALKDKLMAQRLSQPLFDTDRSRRDIERAYTVMWETAKAGGPPRAFAVEADLEK